jgi:hypothetical protein
MQRIQEAIERIMKQIIVLEPKNNLFPHNEPIPSLPPVEAYTRGKQAGLQLACNILSQYVRKDENLAKPANTN